MMTLQLRVASVGNRLNAVDITNDGATAIVFRLLVDLKPSYSFRHRKLQLNLRRKRPPSILCFDLERI